MIALRENRSELLARRLEELSRRTDVAARIQEDPIAVPRRFSDPLDVEVSGWLASALAYGRVPLFRAVLDKILDRMDGRPGDYVRRFDPKRAQKDFGSLYYRMNGGADIAALIFLIRQVTARHGSVGAMFEALYRDEDEDVGPTLDRFVRAVLAVDTSPIYGRASKPYGLTQLLSLPSKGSACKRLNLYLRWMVRPNDGLDFGLWTRVPPSKLIIPLDTHILRLSRYLGLTRRKSSGWAAAAEITRALRRIDPKDPLRFDFSLCHHGISGNCPVGKAPEKCEACPLLPVCLKGRALTR